MTPETPSRLQRWVAWLDQHPRLGPLLRRWKVLWQFLLFSLIGTSGMVIDLIIIAIGLEVFGIDPRLMAIPAFLLVVSWNYALNRWLTFRSDQPQQISRSYLSFVLVCIGGLGVRVATMHLLIEFAGMGEQFIVLWGWTSPVRWVYLANIIGIFVAAVFNFLGSKYIAFASPAHKKDATKTNPPAVFGS